MRTIVVTASSEGEEVSVTGHIRSRTEESLAFRIDGRMLTRHVDVGASVKPGDLIAEIDPQQERDALRAAQARLSAAAAALHEASNNMARQTDLVGKGFSTRVQYDAAERTLRGAKSEVESAAAQVNSTEELLGYTQLLADAPGVVIAKGAEPGEVVRAGQMIVTIAQDGGFDAVFDVPASMIRQTSPDVLVTVALSDDPSIRTTGRVRELSPQADPVTGSYQVKVGLAERPPAMRLGAIVTGRTHMRPKRGIEIPATALTTADNQPAVWVVDPKSQQVSLRSVHVVEQDSSSIVVSNGLTVGELVVTAGVHALRPGQKVRLESARS